MVTASQRDIAVIRQNSAISKFQKELSYLKQREKKLQGELTHYKKIYKELADKFNSHQTQELKSVKSRNSNLKSEIQKIKSDFQNLKTVNQNLEFHQGVFHIISIFIIFRILSTLHSLDHS